MNSCVHHRHAYPEAYLGCFAKLLFVQTHVLAVAACANAKRDEAKLPVMGNVHFRN